jgi:hypothetical protein
MENENLILDSMGKKKNIYTSQYMSSDIQGENKSNRNIFSLSLFVCASDEVMHNDEQPSHTKKKGSMIYIIFSCESQIK